MGSKNNFVSKEKGLFKTSLFGFLPREIEVPFEIGKYIKGSPVVKIGDKVSEGTIIATTESGLNMHSSIPGTVTDICRMENPDGFQCMGAKIALKGSFSYLGRPETKKDWKLMMAGSLRSEFDGKGIINTFNTMARGKSLNEEIEKAVSRTRKPIVCVRLFDDDPSRVTESYASENYWEEVLNGAAIIAKASVATGIIFIKDTSSSFDFKISEEQYKNIFESVVEENCVKVIATNGEKYPTGLKNEIVKTVKKNLKNEILSKNDKEKTNPLSELNHKDLYVDSLTCLSVYNAIVMDLPFISQLVHLTGNCIKASSIMNVRLGTTIKDLAEQSGGFRKKVDAIVVNGVIRGAAANSLEMPVTKEVKSISFLSKSEVSQSQSADCVRCGNCRRVCPASLEPDLIFRQFKNSKTASLIRDEIISKPSINDALVQSTLLCSECALCNTVCTSRLPLCQTISIIKNKIKNGEQNG